MLPQLREAAMRFAAILVVTSTCWPAFAEASPETTPSGAVGAITVQSDDQARRLDTVWVDGMAYQGAASEEFTVFMSLAEGDYYEANLFITNTSKDAFTFDPASIEAMAWKKKRDGTVRRIGIYTYPADEYVGNLKSEAEVRKAFVALGNGFRSASGHMAAASGSGDQAVAESVQRLADAAEEAHFERSFDRIDHHVAVEFDGLLRKHTIFPGTTYGGRVMFGNAKGDTWEFDMKIGSKRFVFVFR
jgi:hypothetical protein